MSSRRSVVVSVAVAAAGVGAQLLRGVWRAIAGAPLGWWFVVVVAAYAALVGWGAWWQARRALLASLAERARRAEAEQAARIEDARRAERARIAREMHDALAHRLSLLATFAGALEYHPDAPPEQLVEAVHVIRSGAHHALEELREVIGVLRDEQASDSLTGAAARPQPTMSDLPALVEESRHAGVTVDFDDLDLDLDHVHAPPNVGRTFYRIVQEALTNARKHAPGQPVHVAVRGQPGG